MIYFFQKKEKKAANIVMKYQTLQNYQGLLWTKLTSSRKKRKDLILFQYFLVVFLVDYMN